MPDCPAPAAPPLLFNDCGKTANFAETVALVEQMEGMICPDSYLMHLAGALAIPTVAIFSTIPPHLRVSAYPCVSALAPDTPCAPCLVIEDAKCPLGHPECVALRSLVPGREARPVHARGQVGGIREESGWPCLGIAFRDISADDTIAVYDYIARERLSVGEPMDVCAV